MEAYELAFRMQTQVPDVIDVTGRRKQTLGRLRHRRAATDAFGRRCLLARRLVEHGVRFVQIYVGGWDSHDYLAKSHAARIRAIDKPIAALLDRPAPTRPAGRDAGRLDRRIRPLARQRHSRRRADDRPRPQRQGDGVSGWPAAA